MLNRLAVFLIDRLEKHIPVDDDDREIYIYSFELLLSNLSSALTMLLISLSFKRIGILSFFFFILFLFTTRLFCGGYHSKTHLRCFLLSKAIFLSCAGLTELVLRFNLKLMMPVLFLLSAVTVFIFSPVKNKNHPCTEETYKKNRKISLWLTSIYTVIYILLFIYMKNDGVVVNAAWSFVWVGLMIAGEKIFEKGGKTHEVFG